MVLSIHTTVVLFIDMTPSCIVCLEQILPWGSTRTIYDNTVTCFLTLCDSWAACPHFHCEVTEWLCIYQGIWVGFACCVTCYDVTIFICVFSEISADYCALCWCSVMTTSSYDSDAVSFLFFTFPFSHTPTPDRYPVTHVSTWYDVWGWTVWYHDDLISP